MLALLHVGPHAAVAIYMVGIYCPQTLPGENTCALKVMQWTSELRTLKYKIIYRLELFNISMAPYANGGPATSRAARMGSALNGTGDSKLPYLIIAPPEKLRTVSFAINIKSESNGMEEAVAPSAGS